MKGPYDIAVLGAGPAGTHAALAGDEKGLRVALLDEQPLAGGQVWRAKSAAILSAPSTPETRRGSDLRNRLSRSGITHQNTARVWHIAREGNLWHLHYLRNGCSDVVQAKALILAAGAREFVQPVEGWTTPGVIGLAGATALFKQDLTVPGNCTVVSGTGPLVFYVASEIRRLGGKVAAVVTPNTRHDWMGALPAMLGKPALLARGAIWMADLMLARVPIFWGHAVTRVAGQTQMEGVEIATLDADWAARNHIGEIKADSLCIGHGLIPQIEAAQMLGVGIRHEPALGGWVPQADEDGTTKVTSLYLCGDGSGIRGADAAAHHGRLCGLRVAADLGHVADIELRKASACLRRAARFGLAMTALSIPRPGLVGLSTQDTIICRCESLSKGDILAQIDSGAASTNAVKSGSRAGMGPCGGKYCQGAIAALIAQSKGRPAASIPPPTARSPLRPVPLGAAAGAFEYDDLPIPKPAPL
ncbi:MAG: NAD(P)/FAD-dependent oxidoreductase [Sulfitobacter sp.]